MRSAAGECRSASHVVLVTKQRARGTCRPKRAADRSRGASTHALAAFRRRRVQFACRLGSVTYSLDFGGATLTNIALIDASAGDDTIIGSAGVDIIKGGAGKDTLSGGGGADIFDYESTAESIGTNIDRIGSFTGIL